MAPPLGGPATKVVVAHATLELLALGSFAFFLQRLAVRRTTAAAHYGQWAALVVTSLAPVADRLLLTADDRSSRQLTVSIIESVTYLLYSILAVVIARRARPKGRQHEPPRQGPGGG